MSVSGSADAVAPLREWLTLERQGPILGGVTLLLALWVGELIEPFALDLPAYALYLPLSDLGRRLGLVAIEGSVVLFWVSAVTWLYLFCAVLLALAIWAMNSLGENP